MTKRMKTMNYGSYKLESLCKRKLPTLIGFYTNTAETSTKQRTHHWMFAISSPHGLQTIASQMYHGILSLETNIFLEMFTISSPYVLHAIAWQLCYGMLSSQTNVFYRNFLQFHHHASCTPLHDNYATEYFPNKQMVFFVRDPQAHWHHGQPYLLLMMDHCSWNSIFLLLCTWMAHHP